MEFNLIACPDKYAQVAVAMGEDVEDLDDMTAGMAAVEAVASLGEDVGIPGTLSEVGVSAGQLGVLCEDSMRSANIAMNPRKTTIEDVRRIYEAAL
jgi:alcohol dehydrogenase